MPLYQHENMGDVTNHIFAKGVITAVDSTNDLADVTVEGYRDGSDTPLFYHCEPDSEERSNGAIYGAAAAFSVDAEVIVMLEVGGAPVRIVGFVDGIKVCCFRFKIIREYDDVVLTPEMLWSDGLGQWMSKYWVSYVPRVVIRSKGGQGLTTVYYGDREWWAEHEMDDVYGENSWEKYHLQYEIETGDYTGEEKILTYDEGTQYFTCCVPTVVKSSEGYLLSLGVNSAPYTGFTQSGSYTELLPPPTDPEEEQPFRYIFKSVENALELPYREQEYTDDEGEDHYTNAIPPGTYTWHVPYFSATLIPYTVQTPAPNCDGDADKTITQSFDIISTIPYQVYRKAINPGANYWGWSEFHGHNICVSASMAEWASPNYKDGETLNYMPDPPSGDDSEWFIEITQPMAITFVGPDSYSAGDFTGDFDGWAINLYAFSTQIDTGY